MVAPGAGSRAQLLAGATGWPAGCRPRRGRVLRMSAFWAPCPAWRRKWP